MKNKNYLHSVIFLVLIIFCNTQAQIITFNKLCTDFIKGYNELDIPATDLDYKVNFSGIKSKDELHKQETFFLNYSKQLSKLDIRKLGVEEKLRYHQINYEVNINLERILLEKKWNLDGRKTPDNGLYQLSNYKDWYAYYIKHFTSVNITPEEVFEMGESEVKKIQTEIKKIQTSLGYIDEDSFFKYLQSDTFYLSDKEQILNAYAQIDQTVRKNLYKLFPQIDIPQIGVMEWPDATASTPPGMYLDKANNPYGKDIFQYNFYRQKHNTRAMEWLYMHEAIPGHHLQFVMRNTNSDSSILRNNFFYFGNAEGWACYVEDYGKEMGLYQNNYSYLGKWQWDLVRSARLVMEVGIHYYGWSREKAMQYWKDNIKGQDEIADREITRITNWAGQALCYKAGALTMKKIVKQKLKQGNSIIEAHQFLLLHSDFPLEVLLNWA
ncbi:MAG TPA: DUF885 domain-containing protein [Bacteroidia bacterium]|nr:DUF885 domain-containing protein [Bacteroidia bacterium]